MKPGRTSRGRRAMLAAGLSAALALAQAAAAPGGEDAAPGPGAYAAAYEITLGGLKLADMSVSARIGADDYAASARLATGGVLGVFYTAGFEAEARGTVGSPLRTLAFDALSHDGDERRDLALRFGPEAPVSLVARPPFRPKPWQVDPLAQAGTVDPLTAAVDALRPQPRAALCDARHEIFDGRRRYRIVLGAPRADGPRVRCPARYERVAGFKPKKMAEPAWPFELWFREGADGLWHLQEAEGSTPFGTAAIRAVAPAGG